MSKLMKKRDLQKSKWYIATVIGCFLFPVGFVWLIVNTVIDFKTRKEKNNAVLYSAIGATIFSLFMSGYIVMVSYMSSEEKTGQTYYLALIYIPALVIAAYLYAVYFVHFHRAKQLSRIFYLIQTDHITSISRLAEITGLDKKATIRHLNTLIKMGNLKNAIVDEKHGEVILKESLWAKQRVICQTCGAEIIVNFGHTLICDYCGGALMVKRVK